MKLGSGNSILAQNELKEEIDDKSKAEVPSTDSNRGAFGRATNFIDQEVEGGDGDDQGEDPQEIIEEELAQQVDDEHPDDDNPRFGERL